MGYLIRGTVQQTRAITLRSVCRAVAQTQGALFTVRVCCKQSMMRSGRSFVVQSHLCSSCGGGIP